MNETMKDGERAAFEEIRSALDEIYKFSSTSPRARDNINFIYEKLDEIEARAASPQSGFDTTRTPATPSKIEMRACPFCDSEHDGNSCMEAHREREARAAAPQSGERRCDHYASFGAASDKVTADMQGFLSRAGMTLQAGEKGDEQDVVIAGLNSLLHDAQDEIARLRVTAPQAALANDARENLLVHADDMDACGWKDDADNLRSLLQRPLTPFGMLVRALRIVAGTTLMDMANALLTTPARLSAMEFGREQVTREFAFDVGAYFDALDVPVTFPALDAARKAEIERIDRAGGEA